MKLTYAVVRAALTFVTLVLSFCAAVSGGELRDGEISPSLGAPVATSVEKPAFEMVVYINGQNTSPSEAKRDAGLIARRINCGVRLIYNDLTLPVIDWFSTLIEKVGDAECSVNAATETLAKSIRDQVEKGASIYIVGHSAGSLSILNAVNSVTQGYKEKSDAERKALLSRIHVLTVGGATFSDENLFADGWPQIGSLHHLWDERDGVVNVWGEGTFWDWFDCDLGDYHGMGTHYVNHLESRMLRESGTTIIKQ